MAEREDEAGWRFYTVVRMNDGDAYRAQLYGEDDDDPPEGYEPSWRASWGAAVDHLQSRGGGTIVVGWSGAT